MPATRPSVDKAQKMTDIVDVAERVVVDEGMAALSVVGVARELGVAANSIYWYFPKRDHLAVAVLERLGERAFASKPRSTASWRAKVFWLVDALADLYPHAAALRETAPGSEVVKDFEDATYARFHQMLSAALADDVRPGTSVEEAADVVQATIFGCFVQRTPAARRRRIVERAIDAVCVAAS
jgi:AcrR family transcriptional regulator